MVWIHACVIRYLGLRTGVREVLLSLGSRISCFDKVFESRVGTWDYLDGGWIFVLDMYMASNMTMIHWLWRIGKESSD